MSGAFSTLMPRCCGERMNVEVETQKFLVLHCGVCDDTVYVKKEYVPEPQMIDD